LEETPSSITPAPVRQLLRNTHVHFISFESERPGKYLGKDGTFGYSRSFVTEEINSGVAIMGKYIRKSLLGRTRNRRKTAMSWGK
jgi:hypothetical protein